MFEVSMVNYVFVPDNITISTGTEVVFRNDDIDIHTVTADDGSFDSGEINPGGEYRYIFDSPGECSAHCEIHPNMKIRITAE